MNREKDEEEASTDSFAESSVGDNTRKEDLSNLTSSGPLSSSARVGIMVALIPLKKATFTELLLAVKVPKSSLNTSLAILEENGYVVIRKGFSALRPRTFIQITQQGEKAIKEHLALMQDLAEKFL